MSPVENLIVMALEISLEAALDAEQDAVAAEITERDRQVLALVKRFGLESVLESVQFAAEQAADAHEHGDRDFSRSEADRRMRATVRELRAVATSIANAVKSSKAVRS